MYYLLSSKRLKKNIPNESKKKTVSKKDRRKQLRAKRKGFGDRDEEKRGENLWCWRILVIFSCISFTIQHVSCIILSQFFLPQFVLTLN